MPLSKRQVYHIEKMIDPKKSPTGQIVGEIQSRMEPFPQRTVSALGKATAMI
jgi:hypothetical protein